MNPFNLPGPGDAATFSHAALSSLALLEEMSQDDQPSDNDICLPQAGSGWAVSSQPARVAALKFTDGR